MVEDSDFVSRIIALEEIGGNSAEWLNLVDLHTFRHIGRQFADLIVLVVVDCDLCRCVIPSVESIGLRVKPIATIRPIEIAPCVRV